MKKSIENGIIAAVVVVGGFAAYQSYGSYGLQNNSLLMQNIEALASNQEPDDEEEYDEEESPTFIRKKCFQNVANDGAYGLICPEGTRRGHFKVCPHKLNQVNPSSPTSFCFGVIINN